MVGILRGQPQGIHAAAGSKLESVPPLNAELALGVLLIDETLPVSALLTLMVVLTEHVPHWARLPFVMTVLALNSFGYHLKPQVVSDYSHVVHHLDTLGISIHGPVRLPGVVPGLQMMNPNEFYVVSLDAFAAEVNGGATLDLVVVEGELVFAWH